MLYFLFRPLTPSSPSARTTLSHKGRGLPVLAARSAHHREYDDQLAAACAAAAFSFSALAALAAASAASLALTASSALILRCLRGTAFSGLLRAGRLVTPAAS